MSSPIWIPNKKHGYSADAYMKTSVSRLLDKSYDWVSWLQWRTALFYYRKQQCRPALSHVRLEWGIVWLFLQDIFSILDSQGIIRSCFCTQTGHDRFHSRFPSWWLRFISAQIYGLYAKFTCVQSHALHCVMSPWSIMIRQIEVIIVWVLFSSLSSLLYFSTYSSPSSLL